MGYLRTEFSEGAVICFHAACGFFGNRIVFRHGYWLYGTTERLDRSDGYLGAAMQKAQDEK
jgi:hypothetical protein